MADIPWSFALVIAFLCLWPLILAGLFALMRRFPNGVPARHRWAMFAVWALVPAALSIDAFLGDAAWRAALFALQAAFFAWLGFSRRAELAR
jgi:hypothetical protein